MSERRFGAASIDLPHGFRAGGFFVGDRNTGESAGRSSEDGAVGSKNGMRKNDRNGAGAVFVRRMTQPPAPEAAMSFSAGGSSC